MLGKDSDGDGIPDSEDDDDDNDGVPDYLDDDDDGDGVLDFMEDAEKKAEGDEYPGYYFEDSTATEAPEEGEEAAVDSDNDGIPDDVDDDDDNDGIPDYEDDDDDGDGVLDWMEDIDSDNDGIPDHEDADDDNDGVPDEEDEDDDGDGIDDADEEAKETVFTSPHDDLKEYFVDDADAGEEGEKGEEEEAKEEIYDADEEGFGIPTMGIQIDMKTDSDGDGIPDFRDDDDDNDGIPDFADIDFGENLQKGHSFDEDDEHDSNASLYDGVPSIIPEIIKFLENPSDIIELPLLKGVQQADYNYLSGVLKDLKKALLLEEAEKADDSHHHPDDEDEESVDLLFAMKKVLFGVDDDEVDEAETKADDASHHSGSIKDTLYSWIQTHDSERRRSRK